MSWEAVNWATAEMRNPDLTTPEKFVLLILANRASPEGECWPSYQYLQDLTGLASSTVRAACKTLEESGLVTIEKRVNEKGGQTSNLYKMAVPPPLPPTGTPPRRKAAAPLPPGGTNTKEVNGEGSKEPISINPEGKNQGQNRPAGPPCAKCQNPINKGKRYPTKIGEVCSPCEMRRLTGGWTDELQEAAV